MDTLPYDINTAAVPEIPEGVVSSPVHCPEAKREMFQKGVKPECKEGTKQTSGTEPIGSSGKVSKKKPMESVPEPPKKTEDFTESDQEARYVHCMSFSHELCGVPTFDLHLIFSSKNVLFQPVVMLL